MRDLKYLLLLLLLLFALPSTAEDAQLKTLSQLKTHNPLKTHIQLMTLSEIKNYTQANQRQILQDFTSFLVLPNISANSQDMLVNAN